MNTPLLLITATAQEASLLRDTVDSLTPQHFPLGDLYLARWGRLEFYLAHLGVAKVNTAAGLALAIERLKPATVLQFGIGGAYVGSFLSIGMIAAAEQEIHIDTGVATEQGWQGMAALGFPLLGEDYYNLFPTDPALLERLVSSLGATPAIFGTSETVTGSFDLAAELQARFDLSIESMEGAAAAQVCAAYGVAFGELRGISNIVGERDKVRGWDIPVAVRAVNQGVLRLLNDLR